MQQRHIAHAPQSAIWLQTSLLLRRDAANSRNQIVERGNADKFVRWGRIGFATRLSLSWCGFFLCVSSWQISNAFISSVSLSKRLGWHEANHSHA
jgi:hypothetical protein